MKAVPVKGLSVTGLTDLGPFEDWPHPESKASIAAV